MSSAPVDRIPIIPTKRDTERIMSHYSEPDSEGCRNWNGAKTPEGYGRTRLGVHGGFRHIYSHRYIATLAYGPIPTDKQVDHLCYNTSCGTVEHLEIVTPVVNGVQRARGRWQLTTHCKHGHERTEANTYYIKGKNPRRTCKPCAIESARSYRERKHVS